jgi:hypothetical protein
MVSLRHLLSRCPGVSNMSKIRSRLGFLALLLVAPAIAPAQINISVNLAPPELPVYVQPPIPEDGYLWTPGYWAWSDDAQQYYWVPGTWVQPPQPEYLWTPAYWGWEGGAYLFHDGYWGPQIGFYGGVNYGFGYTGAGYEGGYWQGGHLFYNRSVNNVSNVHISNVYNKTVVNNVTVNRVSFNGGSGGTTARPTAAELAVARGPHVAATPVQAQHVKAAATNPALRFSANKGNPPIAATSRPGAFTGAGVVAAKHTATPAAAHPAAQVAHPVAHPAAPTAHTAEHPAAPVAHPAPAHPAPAQTAHPAAPPQHAAPPHPAEPPREVPHAAAPPPAEHEAPHPPQEHAPAPRPAEHPPEH